MRASEIYGMYTLPFGENMPAVSLSLYMNKGKSIKLSILRLRNRFLVRARLFAGLIGHRSMRANEIYGMYTLPFGENMPAVSLFQRLIREIYRILDLALAKSVSGESETLRMPHWT